MIRAFLAIELATSMVGLTFLLALRAPESDAFKVLLGAMLTVGFASAIGWYFNSSSGSDKKDETIAIQGVALATSTPATSVTTLDPGPPPTIVTKTEKVPHLCKGKRK